jgi:uncharacterized protein (TIGR03086 family)
VPTNLTAADAAAVRTTLQLTATVTDDRLTLPTPCAGWDLAALLTHMTDQHHIFATAATPEPPPATPPSATPPSAAPSSTTAPSTAPSSTAPPSTAAPSTAPTSAAPTSAARGVRGSARAAALVSAYAAAADRVLATFSQDGVLQRQFGLPEISTGRTFPGHQVVGFHLVDYVVHGWDVARTLGVPYAPDPDAVIAALPIARAVPTGTSRLQPGSAFAPALPLPPHADPLTETLLLLGRDPAWTPAAAGRP